MALSMLLFVMGALMYQASCHPHYAEQHVGVKENDKINIKDAPYLAGVYIKGHFYCAAVIIHEQFVVTSATCINQNENINQYQVTVGSDAVYINEGELFQVEQIHVHENFNNQTYDSDICLIKLSKPLSFSETVKKIRFSNETLKISEGTYLTVTGWFYQHCKNETGPTKPPQFTQTELVLFSGVACIDLCAGRNIALSQKLCTDFYAHDVSSLDSGSALTYNDQLVGITSIDYGCNREVALYTSISGHSCWINNILKV